MVDVSDGRNLRAQRVELVHPEQTAVVDQAAPLLEHVGDEQHVGARPVQIEPVLCIIGEHCRGEGAEQDRGLILLSRGRPVRDRGRIARRLPVAPLRRIRGPLHLARGS